MGWADGLVPVKLAIVLPRVRALFGFYMKSRGGASARALAVQRRIHLEPHPQPPSHLSRRRHGRTTEKSGQGA
jgi:hypothetical protein